MILNKEVIELIGSLIEDVEFVIRPEFNEKLFWSLTDELRNDFYGFEQELNPRRIILMPEFGEDDRYVTHFRIIKYSEKNKDEIENYFEIEGLTDNREYLIKHLKKEGYIR